MPHVAVRIGTVTIAKTTFDIEAWGARRASVWIEWLTFRRHDGRALRTGTETVQRSAEALVQWACRLRALYVAGAFARALDRRRRLAARRRRRAPAGTTAEPPLVHVLSVCHATGRMRVRQGHRLVTLAPPPAAMPGIARGDPRRPEAGWV